MMKHFSFVLVFIISISNASAERLRVFVSIPPQKQFVQMIAGDRVEVGVMLPPGESPETYSPSPKSMVSLAGAVSYFQIGVPFESVWTGSIRSSIEKIHIVECCAGILQAMKINGDDHDVHIWNDPFMVKVLGKMILDELSRVDPANRRFYEMNFQDFIGTLEHLDSSIRQALSGRETDYFIVSHAAWGAFAKRYGLKQLALEKNGKETGPRSLLEIIRIARRENIKTIFIIEQYRPPFIENLAAELEAEIVSLNPLAEDYMTNMERVADQLAGALRAK